MKPVSTIELGGVAYFCLTSVVAGQCQSGEDLICFAFSLQVVLCNWILALKPGKAYFQLKKLSVMARLEDSVAIRFKSCLSVDLSNEW